MTILILLSILVIGFFFLKDISGFNDSEQLRLFKGKEIEIVTKRQVSVSQSDSAGYSERTIPMAVSGFLIGETEDSWLVGENEKEVVASIYKEDVSSMQLIAPKSAGMDVLDALVSDKAN